MLGVRLALQRSARWWPVGAVYAADFVGNRYMVGGVAVDQSVAMSFSRPSAKLAQDSAGVWHSFGPDIPAITDRGLLLEPAATNMVPNAAMVGATPGIIGAGGALPTGWTIANFDTVTVQAVGTEGGLPFIELRLQAGNTTAATRFAYIRAAQFVPATIGQQWTASAFYKLVGGAWYPNGNAFLNVEEKGSSTSYRLGARTGEMTVRARVARSWTADRAGTIQLTFTLLQFDLLPADSVDVTLRVYAPQLALEIAASSPVLTSGTTIARAPDIATLLLPSGTFSLTRTFDDGGTQTSGGITGPYDLPNVSANIVRQVMAM